MLIFSRLYIESIATSGLAVLVDQWGSKRYSLRIQGECLTFPRWSLKEGLVQRGEGVFFFAGQEGWVKVENHN